MYIILLYTLLWIYIFTVLLFSGRSVTDTGTRAALIANPTAGMNKISGELEKIKRAVVKYGYSLDYFETKSRGHAILLAQQAAPLCDILLCYGGDGTLSEVINGMMKTDARPVIGYIPAGTTNDFAASIHLSRMPGKAVKNALLGKPDYVDIGRFENKYFSYVASFGAFTKVSYDTPQKMKRSIGHLAYIVEGMKSLSLPDNFTPRRVTVHANGRVFSGDFIFGAVTNSMSVGGIVKLDRKRVSLSDGLFEVMLIRNPSDFIGICTLAADVLQCRYTSKDVVFFQTNELMLEFDGPVEWSLDGERADTGSTVSVGVVHNAVQISK